MLEHAVVVPATWRFSGSYAVRFDGVKLCQAREQDRPCLALGVLKLKQLEARMDEIADRVARVRTNAAHDRTSTHEAQRLSN
jgi:hypothetical protein